MYMPKITQPEVDTNSRTSQRIEAVTSRSQILRASLQRKATPWLAGSYLGSGLVRGGPRMLG
jgi:hypothetical protein